MITRAVILAGGEGSRLRPMTLEIPKPLIPVQGRPILTWQARWMARHGVTQATVVIPPKWKEAFERWRNDVELTHASIPQISLWVEPEPMGTMGAFVHHLHDRFTEDFFVTNGDELIGLDLSALGALHRERIAASPSHAATMGLIRVPNPSDYGVVEMDGPKIVRFHEKPAHPPTDLINAGLYAVSPQALQVPDRSRAFLMFEKDLFPQLAEQGRLAGCVLDGPWFDCGTMERWEKAIREWKEI